MRKNDFILFAFLLLIAATGYLLYAKLGNREASMVRVTVDGEVFGTYSLKEDKEIVIHDSNIILIQDECVDMIEADCPDQICVKHKIISKNLETIVCLPNKVVVEIVGGENAVHDALAN